MRKVILPLARLLDIVQRRFQRSRAGSVMILVVTLLVLMAIIGTAFLTTARNDRYSTQLHESNVQVDMLLDGVKNILLSRMASENFLDPDGQRWDDVHSDNWLASRTPTMMIDACGLWNGARVYNRGDWVQVTKPQVGFYVSTTDNNLNNDPTKGGPWMVDPQVKAFTPCWEGVTSLFDLVPGVGFSAEDVRGSVGNGGFPANFDGTRGRNLVQLVFVDPTGGVVSASSVQSNGQYYPAFRFYRPANPNTTPATPDGFQVTLAASASGNGIADSFLWRLPMGEINGVTYYAAVRVVDNNSAINLNTAGTNLYDFDAQGNPLPNMSFFPGNTGVAELLSTFNVNGSTPSTLGQEFGALNLYRNTGSQNYVNGSQVPLPDGIISTMNPSNMGGPTAPIADSGGKWGTRPDFRYLSLADAQFMGLGRRIDLPGYSIQSAGSGAPYLFNSFSWSDSAALAYHFDLVPQATFQSNYGTGGASTVESILAPSLWQQNYYRSMPWDPSPTNPPYAQNWFNLNYIYTTLPFDAIVAGVTPFNPLTNLSNTYNRRPLVIARNPQSNMMPVHVREMDALRAWAPSITTAMGYNLNPAALDPARANIPRVSLNTASPLITLPPPPSSPAKSASYATDYPFATDVPNPVDPRTAPVHTPTLWLGFYNAMLPALEEPYTDHRLFSDLNFQLPANGTNYFRPSAAQPPYQLAQQFRSSLRDPSGIGPYIPNRPGGNLADADANTWLPPASELLLRSLIASVNAQDIRDSDDDVTSATFFGLPVMSSNTLLSGGAKVTAFGTERQPFITEIYVNNDISIQPANFQGPGGVNIANNVTANDVNPLPYVAVELYNPYDIDIPLAGYVLAAMNRATTTFPGMTLRQISTTTTFTNARVPAHGFLVLESVNVAGDQTKKTYRPWWVYPGTKVNNDPTAADSDRTGSNYCYVSGLDTILTDPTTGNADELYLLKPRVAGATTALQSSQVGNFAQGAFFNEASLTDLVPVDSFDFFGMSASTGGTFQAWHYVRANAIFTDTVAVPPINPPRPSWKFVFAGHWEPGQVPAVILGAGPAQQNPTPPPAAVREDGVATGGSWATGSVDPWIVSPPGWTGVVNGTPTQPPDGPAAPIKMDDYDFASSYSNPYPGIPLNNTGYGVSTEPTGHGINKNLTSDAFASYPFGGFARNGDLLQVPFVGAYTIINPATGAIIEMNPVTKDVGFADDNNLNYVWNISSSPPLVNPAPKVISSLPRPRTINPNTWYPTGTIIQLEDHEEQLGRFAPLSSVDGDPANFLPVNSIENPAHAYFPAGSSVGYSIPWTDGTNTENRLFDTYGWASKIFDYFSASQTPNDDYLPDTKWEYYWPYSVSSPAGYVTTTPLPTIPVANSPAGTSSPNGSVEATTPIEGLININTAPWRVLAQLPFYCPNPAAGAGQTANVQMLTANMSIAQAIVRYREAFGPFHSIFDLNRVFDPYGTAYDPTSSQIFQNQDGIPGNGPPDSTDYKAYQGVLTPNLPGFLNDGGVIAKTNTVDPAHLPDGLITDFNQREAEVMRLSNLITTRSDSFTVYLQIQGWRGAGTPGAQLVVQRRAAFIMDRTGTTRTADANSNASTIMTVNIPTKVQTQ